MIDVNGQLCGEDSVESAFVDDSDVPLERFTAFNAYVFITLLNAQRQGKTCLPNNLGISGESLTEFHQFIRQSSQYSDSIIADVGCKQEDTRQTLLEMRLDEWMELKELLLAEVEVFHPSILWMAEVTSAGCLGGDHLWRDLGLPTRALLGDLLVNNFPVLAARNHKDMKWKKFFYKQLCERDGGYVCRAPTCEQCAVYDDCFGPEE